VLVLDPRLSFEQEPLRETLIVGYEITMNMVLKFSNLECCSTPPLSINDQKKLNRRLEKSEKDATIQSANISSELPSHNDMNHLYDQILYISYADKASFLYIHSHIPTPSKAFIIMDIDSAAYIYAIRSSQPVFSLVCDEFNLENRRYGLAASLRPVGRHGHRVRKGMPRRSPSTTTVHGLGIRQDESQFAPKHDKVLDSCSLNSQVLTNSNSQAGVPRSS